jgi:hypothetical protein
MFHTYRALILVLAALSSLGGIILGVSLAFPNRPSETFSHGESIFLLLVTGVFVPLVAIWMASRSLKSLREASWYESWQWGQQFNPEAERTSSRGEEENTTISSETYDPFKVLELKPHASPKEIKKAYRFLLMVWHPDRFPQGSEIQKRAQEKTKQIIEAYRRIQSSP